MRFTLYVCSRRFIVCLPIMMGDYLCVVEWSANILLCLVYLQVARIQVIITTIQYDIYYHRIEEQSLPVMPTSCIHR